MFQSNPRSTDRFIRAQRLDRFRLVSASFLAIAATFPATAAPAPGRRARGRVAPASRVPRPPSLVRPTAGCRWNILPVLDVRSEAPPSAPIRRAPPPARRSGARAGQRSAPRASFAALHPLLPGHTVHSSIYSHVNKDLSSGHLLVHTAPPGSHSERHAALQASRSPTLHCAYWAQAFACRRAGSVVSGSSPTALTLIRRSADGGARFQRSRRAPAWAAQRQPSPPRARPWAALWAS